MNIGTGIAAGIVTNGALLRGGCNYAGELGLTIIGNSANKGARADYCTLEGVASGEGIADRARSLLSERKDAALHGARTDGGLSASTIFEACDRGDGIARRVVDEAVGALGRTVANLIFLLNPEAIVFGGGVVADGWLVKRIGLQVKTLLADKPHFIPKDISVSAIGAARRSACSAPSLWAGKISSLKTRKGRECIMNGDEELRNKIMTLAEPATWEKSIKLSQGSILELKTKIDLKLIKTVYIVGCGSSLASAYVGESWIEHIARVPSKALPAYQFLKYTELGLMEAKETLVVGVTAGGTTESVRASLEKARRAGVPTIAITGDGDLPCARAADVLIATDSLNECPRHARTTSYIDMLLGLFVLSLALGESKGSVKATESQYWGKQLNLLLAAVPQIPQIARQVEAVAEALCQNGLDRVFVLGTGAQTAAPWRRARSRRPNSHG